MPERGKLMRAAAMKERLVVAGAGMAGLKLLEELVAQCPGRYDIVIAGAEAHPPYNRVLLSSLLAGEAERGDVELRPATWYAENDITFLSGVAVSSLHATRREAALSHGTCVAYDRLVMATGSKPMRLPIPGQALPGVHAFRDLHDVAALQQASPGSRAVVIGGGLLGIEAAWGLAKRRLDVTLIHIMPHLMERQLDARAGRLLKGAMEARGIEIVLNAHTAAIEGDGRAERVLLKDGRAFPADIVVMAAGIRPETALAESASIEIGRGIKVDDRLETSLPGVYAIGECAEHRGICYGIVEPVYEQARVLARHLADKPAHYDGSLLATSLKVSGVPVFSMGDVQGDGGEAIVLEDEGAATYRKLVVRDDRLAGVVLFGDTSDAFWYRDLISKGLPLSRFRPMLAFGKAHAEAA
jgi:nitrite reductase (NADH) large subunit